MTLPKSLLTLLFYPFHDTQNQISVLQSDKKLILFPLIWFIAHLDDFTLCQKENESKINMSFGYYMSFKRSLSYFALLNTLPITIKFVEIGKCTLYLRLYIYDIIFTIRQNHILT